MNELTELCRTAGVRVLDVLEQRRPEADPKYLIGRGKLEEVLIRAMQLDANVLIFDPDLTPAQAHAITDFTDLKVIDRTMLILDIFAQHAKSRDGKLQVELAQLRYPLPRLHEKNTMMSRLTGGIGGRGPGETKLEENRRRARERIHRLEKEIDRFGEQRAGRRAERARRGLPIVAIVGYTNAGKSTLLNTLTSSDVLAEDKLFATLDPTTRRLRFPREREIIITDTVGFIRDLPTRSGARRSAPRWRSWTRPTCCCTSSTPPIPAHEQQIAAVEAILADLGLAETPRILVMNKIDLAARRGAGARSPRGDGELPAVADLGARRATDAAAAGGDRGGALARGVRGRRRARRPDGRRVVTRRPRRHEPARPGPPRVAGAAGRADPGARARALRVREAVRRQGAALLARLRPAHRRLHPRRDRVPAVAGPARRLRAPAGRGSGRADPAHRPPARAGGQAAVAALHGRRRRAGVQPAAAAAHLLRPLRRPAHAAAADDRDGAARPAGRARRACCPAIASRASTASRVRYWEELERVISNSAGKTLRFAIRRGPDAEERDVTPIEIERSGPLRRKERVGWIGVSPRFHLPEIGVLDPSSPAAQAGLKTFDFITAVNGVPVAHLDRVRAGRSSAPGASPLRLNYVRGGYSAVPFAHIEIEEPGSAVVIPVAVFDAAGRRHYETGILSAELFVFSVEPGSPADRIGLRRGDQIQSLDGAPLPHWDVLRERLAASPTTDFRIGWISPGGVHHEATLPPGGPLASWTSTARRSSTWCSARSTGWPGRPRPPVPITNRFGYALGHAFERTGEIIATMIYGFGEIVRGHVPLTTLGGPIMIGYAAGVAAEQGLRPVPVADGGHQRQPRPAELPAGADPRRRPAGVLHAGAVQAPPAVAARAPDRHLRRPGHRRRC